MSQKIAESLDPDLALALALNRIPKLLRVPACLVGSNLSL